MKRDSGAPAVIRSPDSRSRRIPTLAGEVARQASIRAYQNEQEKQQASVEAETDEAIHNRSTLIAELPAPSPPFSRAVGPSSVMNSMELH